MNELRQILDEVHKLSGQDTNRFVALLITHLIRDVVYYVVLGWVAVSLGRRIIEAVTAGRKQYQRDREDATAPEAGEDEAKAKTRGEGGGA